MSGCAPITGGTPIAGPPGPPGPAGGSCWPALRTIDASDNLDADTWHQVTPSADIVLTFPDPSLTPRCVIGVEYVGLTTGFLIDWAGTAPGDLGFDPDAMLFCITGESAIFVSDGSQWQVQTDGRIPTVAEGIRIAAQSIPNLASTQIIPDFFPVDNAAIWDAATSRFIPKRPGLYRIATECMLAVLGNQKWMVGTGGLEFGTTATSQAWSSSPGGSTSCSVSTDILLPFGKGIDPVGWLIQHNQGVAVNTTQAPRVMVLEVFTGGRRSGVA